ncbi:MAG TPA: aspartate aminotransferase family protein [Bacteroidia bacterium]|jgi:acetylornithine/N-succinyldiaminopimelate aminotransferase|nr:aspartate aminotransferase family protein [Bacteroidia bacterium]
MKLFDVYPLFDIEPVKARGSWIWDKEGKKYLDFYGGHAVISIGHSHYHYVERLEEQLEKIAFYSNSVKINQQEELAHKLGELSGYTDYALFLCNSGAEANENALKLASFHNGRKKIIAFEKSFHGRTSLAVAATNDTSIQAPVNSEHEIIFLPLNDEEAFSKAIDKDVCAVIIEGIQGVAGIKTPSTEFLKLLRKKCDETGAILILDEVQSGYGRSGKFFAHQFANIKPDIITIAKGMGNGFPVAGALISPKIKAKHGMLGTTFGGNYLACVAAIAVLDVIKEENLLENSAEIGNYLIEKLKAIEGVKEVRGTGLMIGVELYFNSAQVRNDLVFKHQTFTGSASNKNTIRLLPPLNINKEEADHFLKGFVLALQPHLQSVSQ